MKDNPSTPVYIVEDDPLSRKLLVRLVSSWGYRPVPFATAEDFTKARIIRPSCVLLDVDLPGMDGLALQEKLFRQGHGPAIIFLTGHGNVPMSVQAMKKGAHDFLLKPYKPTELRRALGQALERDGADFRKESVADSVRERLMTLTPREREVMREVVAGKLNKQIARALGITERTVKAHRSQVMKKMQVPSVAQLVRCQASF